MKTIMASKSPQDLSPKKQLHWTSKVSHEEEDEEENTPATTTPAEAEAEKANTNTVVVKKTALSTIEEEKKESGRTSRSAASSSSRRKLQAVAVSRLKSILTVLGRNKGSYFQQGGLGTRLVGTLFGFRRGHVSLAFQKDPNSHPVFLVELATPITGLVREMASGLVRIALECDKGAASGRLIEQPRWRTYCNGKKCGFATKREVGEKEWEILKAVEPISMGAGVLPTTESNNNGEGEIMYMRAKFERVVGSRDSEAFYMMNPDSNGAPELSIYLLRV